jgi:virginiamycin B lyase
MRRRTLLAASFALPLAAPLIAPRANPFSSHGARADEAGFRVTYFPVEAGAGSRDVTEAPDGTMLYLGQRNGTLGRLNPATGEWRSLKLGEGSAPHGVVIGPDRAAWITDGGQNAIARVDLGTDRVTLFPLPAGSARANLNTGVFAADGTYWFTGQNGIHGQLNPATGAMRVWQSPKGRGSYGITRTPAGEIWFVSLAGSYLGRIDQATGAVTVVEPPTPAQGARRVWSDSRGVLWVSEWNSGNVSAYDPATQRWRVWKLPGERPRAYSVYVDAADKVWLTDFPANSIVRFDPVTERFQGFPSDRPNANVRQMDGRRRADGTIEAWGGESGNNRLVRIEVAGTV